MARKPLDPYKGDFLTRLREAGEHGSLRRRSWPDDRVLFVGRLTMGGAVDLVDYFRGGIGNYEQDEGDMRARDWVVVARGREVKLLG